MALLWGEAGYYHPSLSGFIYSIIIFRLPGGDPDGLVLPQADRDQDQPHGTEGEQDGGAAGRGGQPRDEGQGVRPRAALSLHQLGRRGPVRLHGAHPRPARLQQLLPLLDHGGGFFNCGLKAPSRDFTLKTLC